MDVPKKFSERLVDILFDNKLTARQLSKKLTIPEAAISYWLSGKKMISLMYALKLADFFNCSIDYLIGISDDALTYTSQPLIPFQRRLREVLKERKCSRYALNKNTKFKDGYFSNWDKGATPQMLTLIELADILDCSIDYLIGRER